MRPAADEARGGEPEHTEEKAAEDRSEHAHAHDQICDEARPAPPFMI